MSEPSEKEKGMLSYFENAVHAYNEFYGPGEREEADAIRALILDHDRLRKLEEKVGEWKSGLPIVCGDDGLQKLKAQGWHQRPIASLLREIRDFEEGK